VPIAIKDTFDVKGKRTTVGMVTFYYNPAPEEDAALVKEIRDSGAIFFFHQNDYASDWHGARGC
jgi:Asp-tRNA(Asn)/Glu-tRNA(Gln) amidotransferase A subunit family amidase